MVEAETPGVEGNGNYRITALIGSVCLQTDNSSKKKRMSVIKCSCWIVLSKVEVSAGSLGFESRAEEEHTALAPDVSPAFQ